VLDELGGLAQRLALPAHHVPAILSVGGNHENIPTGE
jgi:hypothetical protein